MKPSSASIAETVSFPLEAKSFNEIQAKLAGRQLDELDKKLNIAYLEIINGYYEDGQNDKKYESFYEDAARWFEEQGKTKSFLVWQSFFKSVDYWCQLAFKRVREFAGLQAEQRRQHK